mgnify:CR=1 FL=1
MAFDAAARQSIERDVAAHVAPIPPPALCRDQFDIGYRIHEQSVEIFAVRPRIRQHYPVAKTTYIRTRDVWRLYWRKHDGTWHGYAPLPEASDLARVLQEVDTDPLGRFWG